MAPEPERMRKSLLLGSDGNSVHMGKASTSPLCKRCLDLMCTSNQAVFAQEDTHKYLHIHVSSVDFSMSIKLNQASSNKHDKRPKAFE